MFAIPKLKSGDPIHNNGLTVFPLFPSGKLPASPGYELSDEAFAKGTAIVEEVTEGGSVPNLAVTVTGPAPVLFLEGEELRGAKQNRVLNTSVLVPGNTKTLLPVSCVERGRWRYMSKSFGSAGTHASYKLRKVLKQAAGQSARAGRGHESDQGAVWAEVDRQMDSLKAASPTAAMADTYAAHAEKLEECRTQVAYPKGAIGLAAAVGGRVVALDLFDAPHTCEKVWARLLTGIVLDAVEEESASGTVDVAAALQAFQKAGWAEVAPAGAGEEYRVEDAAGWIGSALSLEGRLLHGSLVTAV